MYGAFPFFPIPEGEPDVVEERPVVEEQPAESTNGAVELSEPQSLNRQQSIEMTDADAAESVPATVNPVEVMPFSEHENDAESDSAAGSMDEDGDLRLPQDLQEEAA